MALEDFQHSDGDLSDEPYERDNVPRTAGQATKPAAPTKAEATEARPVPRAAAAAPTPASRGALRRRPWRKLVLAAALGGVFLVGGYEVYRWWTVGRFIVSTDDAYVQADITVIAAKISGYVADVPVVDNQAVKAGDVIARIDDGDYRLAVQSAQDKLATQDSTISRIGRQIDAAGAAVDQAAAQLDAARADAVRAGADYARLVQLARSDFASKARLDQVTADRDR